MAGPRRREALNPDGLLRISKRRAREVRIPTERVKVHDLCHLAAELRRTAGARVEEIQAILDLAHLKTTARYLSRLERRRDPGWTAAYSARRGGKV